MVYKATLKTPEKCCQRIDQAHLTVLLVTIGLSSFFGLVIGLGGSAILSLRREINKISDKLA